MSLLLLANECTTSCDDWHAYLGLLTDVPHIAFEITLEALTGIVVYPLFRRARKSWMQRTHEEIDREHGIPPHD